MRCIVGLTEGLTTVLTPLLNILIALLVIAGGGSRSIVTWVIKKTVIWQLYVHDKVTMICFRIPKDSLGFISLWSVGCCFFLKAHWIFLPFQICVGHVRFVEATVVMNAINHPVWMKSGLVVTHFHPVAQVDSGSRVSNLFSVESLASLQNIPPQSCTDEAKYTFIKYMGSIGESGSFSLCHHLHSCLQAVSFFAELYITYDYVNLELFLCIMG